MFSVTHKSHELTQNMYCDAILLNSQYYEPETWPVKNENTSIQYPVWFSNIGISIQSEEYWKSISISMPKKLKYQYSVSVSFLEKSVKKQANQANLKNWGELKFLLNRQ